MPETRISFIERPSLAVIGEKLTRRFGVHIIATRTSEGVEFSVDGELTEPQREKLELIMERLGFIEAED